MRKSLRQFASARPKLLCCHGSVSRASKHKVIAAGRKADSKAFWGLLHGIW